MDNENFKLSEWKKRSGEYINIPECERNKMNRHPRSSCRVKWNSKGNILNIQWYYPNINTDEEKAQRRLKRRLQSLSDNNTAIVIIENVYTYKQLFTRVEMYVKHNDLPTDEYLNHIINTGKEAVELFPINRADVMKQRTNQKACDYTRKKYAEKNDSYLNDNYQVSEQENEEINIEDYLEELYQYG